MIGRMLLPATLLAGLAMSGCSVKVASNVESTEAAKTTPRSAENASLMLRQGMTRAEVESQLGKPRRVEFDGAQEHLVFSWTGEREELEISIDPESGVRRWMISGG